MTRLLLGEIKPGVVVFLNDDDLREKSDCSSSAYVEPGGKHCVIEGPHYFLILKEIEDGIWLAAPMTSRDGRFRHPLDKSLNGGFIDEFYHTQSYHKEREFWKLSTNSICRSSSQENSSVNNRRIYGQGLHANLQPILQWHARNPYDFLTVGPKPR